jgi:hypothetical protein
LGSALGSFSITLIYVGQEDSGVILAICLIPASEMWPGPLTRP